MTLSIGQHLLWASVGVGGLVLAAALLRALAGRDAVWRYRILVALLPALIAILPLQLVMACGQPFEWPDPVARLATDAVGLVPQMHAARSGSPPAAQPARRALGGAVRWARDLHTDGELSLWLMLYCTGVSIAGIAFARRWHQARTLIRKAGPLQDQAVGRLARDLADELGVSPPQLRISDGAASPASCGVWHPIVLLPRGCGDAVERASLECALRHELVHVARHDALVALAVGVLGVVMWFHPGVWWFCMAVARDRELSCDAQVVSRTGRPKSYALALLDFCHAHRRGVLRRVGVGFGTVVPLKRRLQMIERNSTSGRCRSTVLAVATTLCVVALLAVQAVWSAAVLAGHGPAIALRPGPSPQGPIQTAEIHAVAEGREPATVLNKWVSFLSLHDPARLDAMFRPGEHFTDQETLLSCERARHNGHSLSARSLIVNLPEGSKLRAHISGAAVIMETADQTTLVTVDSGTLRVFDALDVERVVVQAATPTGRLHLETSMAGDEVSFQATATDAHGKPVDVQASFDPDTKTHHESDDPPQGANRYELLTPDDPEEGRYRLKMQWIYEFHKLRQLVEEHDD
jgi:beta-lactamase regulating signal transducer with metallopeptidase domain